MHRLQIISAKICGRSVTNSVLPQAGRKFFSTNSKLLAVAVEVNQVNLN